MAFVDYSDGGKTVDKIYNDYLKSGGKLDRDTFEEFTRRIISEYHDKDRAEVAKITNISLSMADHGVLTLDITLDGNGWGVVYGGYVLGKGYLGAKEFKGSAEGLEAIMRIMDTIGVDELSKAIGKYVRVIFFDGWGSRVKKIGNIIEDKWFDYQEFFDKKGDR